MKRLNAQRWNFLGICLWALLGCSHFSEARLGDTSLQCSDRYGSPKTDVSTKTTNKYFPLLEGAIVRTYEYKGWRIRAAFLDLEGPAVRVEYQKTVSGGIKDFEIDAILKANTPEGTSWREALPPRIMARRWVRSDQATAIFDCVAVRLELPAAKNYEQELKLKKEMKARKSVPQF